MRQKLFVLLSLCLVVAATAFLQIKSPLKHGLARRAAGYSVGSQSAVFNARAVPNARIVAAYGKLPLSFEANQGQTDSQVKFLSRGGGYSLFLTSNEAVLSLRKSVNPSRDSNGAGPEKPSRDEPGSPAHSDALGWREGARSDSRLRDNHGPLASARGSVLLPDPSGKSVDDQSSEEEAVLHMKLAGANPSPQVSGLDELPGKTNYFIGNDPKKWRTNVPTYAKVKYSNVYPGIDLIYYGNQRQLEYDFVVAPGADPQAIRLAFPSRDSDGAVPLRIDSQGDLVVHAGGEEVRLRKPVVYQEVHGQRQGLAGKYVLEARDEIRFELASYDKTKSLVVDPVVVYSTFLGGSQNDHATGIAVDSLNNAYVTGFTTSPDFPTANPFQGQYANATAFTTSNPAADAFVTKFNTDGSGIIYSTYLGGTGDDRGAGIAVDSSGNAYVTGQTNSPNFPTTAGAFQTMASQGSNGFVTKVNFTGSALVYSTYLNLNGGNGIALDQAGNAYVVGNVGISGISVTKLNPLGNSLVYFSRPISGSDFNDSGEGIAVDQAGDAFVVGFTRRSNFLTTPGAFQTTPGLDVQGGFSGSDAFVFELNSAGNALVYSTYLGGKGADQANSIAVDSGGNAYVTGSTSSGDFPLLNAFQALPGGGSTDAFITKLNSTGTAIVYSSFYGADAADAGRGIAVDAAGNSYSVGRKGNIYYLLKITTDGAMLYSSLFGNADDMGLAISIDSSGDAYVAGSTDGLQTTSGSFQPRNNSPGTNAFVIKIADNSQPPPRNPVPVNSGLTPSASIAGSPAFALTVNGSNFVAGAVVEWNGSDRITSVMSSTQLTALISAADIATAGTTQVTVSNPPPGGGASNALNFVVVPRAPPSLNPGGVANGASFSNLPLAAGSIASVFGANFATFVVAGSLPLPKTLGGVSLQINGMTVPLFAVSLQQINFQVPWELLGQSQASITVIVNGVTSNAATINLGNSSPGLFSLKQQGTGQGAILIGGTLMFAAPVGALSTSRPARQGEFVTIFCTGLGPVTNQPGSGAAVPTVPQSLTTTLPTVTVGGMSASVSFSGLAPGFVGLYQVNIQVPQNAPVGDAVPVVLSIGGVTSNTVTMAVQSPPSPF